MVVQKKIGLKAILVLVSDGYSKIICLLQLLFFPLATNLQVVHNHGSFITASLQVMQVKFNKYTLLMLRVNSSPLTVSVH